MLEVRGVSRYFGAVRALESVDIDVVEGEILGIIGPNGCGKTTLFNCISGRYQPTRGTIVWRGRDITGLPMHKVARHGLVRTFQESRIFPSATVGDNVELALAIARSHRRVAGDAVPEDASALLEATGLTPVAGALAADLPFGYLRQLGIALALAVQPRLLLLDEPAAGLNAAEGAELSAILRRLHAKGMTLVVVDHDMDFLLPLAQRIVVLASGEKLAEGPPEDVRKNPAVIEVYLGSVAARHDIATVGRGTGGDGAADG
jgi:branched-chain amino acid transport system ATP-binding protein